MTVDELREQLAQLPGHYDVAIPLYDADDREDLTYARQARVEGASHVFVVIR